VVAEKYDIDLSQPGTYVTAGGVYEVSESGQLLRTSSVGRRGTPTVYVTPEASKEIKYKGEIQTETARAIREEASAIQKQQPYLTDIAIEKTDKGLRYTGRDTSVVFVGGQGYSVRPEDREQFLKDFPSQVAVSGKPVSKYGVGYVTGPYQDPYGPVSVSSGKALDYTSGYSSEFMEGRGARPSDVSKSLSDLQSSLKDDTGMNFPFAVGKVSYVSADDDRYLSITSQEQVKAEKAYQEYQQLPDRPTWIKTGAFISGLTESSLVSGMPGAYVSPKGAKTAEAILLTSGGTSVLVSSLLESAGKAEKGSTEGHFRRAIGETATTGIERVSSFAGSPVGIATSAYFAGMGYGTVRATVGTYIAPSAASWTAPLFTASEYALGGAMTSVAAKSIYDPLKAGDVQTAGERALSSALGFGGFYAGYKTIQQPKFYDVEYLEGIKRTEKRLKQIGDTGNVVAKTIEGQVEPVRTEYTLRDILKMKEKTEVSYTAEYTDPLTGLEGAKGESVKYDLYTTTKKQATTPEIPDIIEFTGGRKKTYIAGASIGEYGEVVGLAKGEVSVDILSPIKTSKFIGIKDLGKKGTVGFSLEGGARPSLIETYEMPSLSKIPIGALELGPVFGGKPLFVPVSTRKEKSVSVSLPSVDVSVGKIRKSAGYLSESIKESRISVPTQIFSRYIAPTMNFETVSISSKASESVQELVKTTTFDVPETPSRDIPTDIMKPPGGMGFAIPPINWGASLFGARMKKSKEKRRFKYQPTVTGIAKSMTTGEFAKKVKKEASRCSKNHIWQKWDNEKREADKADKEEEGKEVRMNADTKKKER